jgi:hypothetical protein
MFSAEETESLKSNAGSKGFFFLDVFGLINSTNLPIALFLLRLFDGSGSSYSAEETSYSSSLSASFGGLLLDSIY